MIGEELLRRGIRRGRRTTRRELKRDGGADHVPSLLERWGLRQEQVETLEAAHLRNWAMKGGGQRLVARRKQNQRRLCLVKGERLEHVLNVKWQGAGRGWGLC